MSGLEVVGSIASVMQLAGTIYAISKTLYEVGDALSNAPSDIKDLARDLETFSEELHLLSSLLDGKYRYSDRVYSLTAKIIGDCATICVKIDRILKKLRSTTVWARVKWLYKEKEILKLLTRLRDLKLSLMGILSLLGALKADHMMDAMGVTNASLLDGPKDGNLAEQTRRDIGRTRIKLAGISMGKDSDMSNSETSSITLQSNWRSRSLGASSSSSNLTEQPPNGDAEKMSTESRMISDVPPLIRPAAQNILIAAVALPRPNSIMQNPAAMDSMQSFHSAFSHQTVSFEEATSTGATTSSNNTFPQISVPQNLGLVMDLSPNQKWRRAMVDAALSNFQMTQEQAEAWADSLHVPNATVTVIPVPEIIESQTASQSLHPYSTTDQPIERERKPYAALPSDSKPRSNEGGIKIERDRQPYTTRPGSGKRHTDNLSLHCPLIRVNSNSRIGSAELSEQQALLHFHPSYRSDQDGYSPPVITSDGSETFAFDRDRGNTPPRFTFGQHMDRTESDLEIDNVETAVTVTRNSIENDLPNANPESPLLGDSFFEGGGTTTTGVNAVEKDNIIDPAKSLPGRSKELWRRAFDRLKHEYPDATSELMAAINDSNRSMAAGSTAAQVAKTAVDNMLLHLRRVSKQTILESSNAGLLLASIGRIEGIARVMEEALKYEHGTLAWICFSGAVQSLPLRKDNFGAYASILNSYADIATLIARYNVLENVYQRWSGMSLDSHYEVALVDLCVLVLAYIAGFLKLADADHLVMEDSAIQMTRIMEADATCRCFTATFSVDPKIEDLSEDDGDSDSTVTDDRATKRLLNDSFEDEIAALITQNVKACLDLMLLS